MTNFVVYPKGIKFESWASQLRNVTTALDFPIPTQGALWRNWAFQLFLMNPNKMTDIPIPDVVAFPEESDWMKWGSFLVFTLMNK